MKSPIYNGLIKYNTRRRVKFSGAGHRGKVRMRAETLCLLDYECQRDGMRNTNVSEILKKGEFEVAGIFGAEKSYYLNGGISAGIYAALASVLKAGDKIIVDPQCDKAVINAIIILALNPVFIKRSHSQKYNIDGGIDTQELEYLAEQHHDARAMFITTPTCHGVCANISKACEIAHENNMVLIVDESFGAHFNFYENFPEPALICGADMVIHDFSKTMGGFSGSALLHINSQLVNIEYLEEQLSVYQSSGGSMAFVCTTENALYYAFENRKKYKLLLSELEQGRYLINQGTDIMWLDVEYNNGCNIDEVDITRIVLNFSKVDISAADAEKILINKYGIEPDYTDGDNLVLSVSLYNTPTEVRKLINSCISIAKIASPKVSLEEDDEKDTPSRKRVQVIPFKAFNCEGEKVEYTLSTGRLCRKMICKLPQNIPIIIPGEKITPKHIETISNLLESGKRVDGIDSENRIEVLSLSDSFYI